LEVLSFPGYDAQKRTFKKHKKDEDAHRKYGKENQYINIPSILLDDGFLKSLNSVETLLSLIKLYDRFDWDEFRGVDFRLVYAYCLDNPSGFVSDEKSRFSNVTPHSHWNICNKSLNHLSLNTLLEAGLLSFTPALIYQDPLDPELTYRKEVAFKMLESGNFSFPTPPENHKVIWILQPTYQVILKSPPQIIETT
jgi:hypothetical protein